MKANGTVFKYGDNVDTDVIIPATISEFVQIRQNWQPTAWRILTKNL